MNNFGEIEYSNEETCEQLEKLNEAHKIREAMFYLFESDRGKIVLDYLSSQTDRSYLESNDMMASGIPVSASQFVMIREGQAGVLKFIKQVIESYRVEKGRV